MTLRNTFIQCKKANPKLHALNRISRFLSQEQHVLIINSYIRSIFIYCPLVWMFCYRGITHKMNKVHERSLRLLLKNFNDDFQDLLRSSGDVSIHQRCINPLTEVHSFFINNQGQTSALKVAYIFKVFGAQNCLMFDQLTYVCKEYSNFQGSKPIFLIIDFKIFPKMLLRYFLMYCWFSSYFTLIERKTPLFFTQQFLLVLSERGSALTNCHPRANCL